MEYIIDVQTPLGFEVRTTLDYWNIIVTQKHPVMKNNLDSVIDTLIHPDEIRQSKKDEDVYLFYRKIDIRKWYCVVIKKEDDFGFLITTYPTNNIKEGKTIWKK